MCEKLMQNVVTYHRDQETSTWRPNKVQYLFYYTCEPDVWFLNSHKTEYCVTYENYMKLKFLCPLVKIYWNIVAMFFVYILSGYLCIAGQNWEVVIEIIWCTKPKIYFTTWTFTENMCLPLLWKNTDLLIWIILWVDWAHCHIN